MMGVEVKDLHGSHIVRTDLSGLLRIAEGMACGSIESASVPDTEGLVRAVTGISYLSKEVSPSLVRIFYDNKPGLASVVREYGVAALAAAVAIDKAGTQSSMRDVARMFAELGPRARFAFYHANGHNYSFVK